MPGRSIAFVSTDSRVQNGVSSCLELATRRNRSRYEDGGLRLRRKQRLPKKDAHIGRIAIRCTKQLEALVLKLREDKTFTFSDEEALDDYYWAQCGILKGYRDLEHNGWIDENAGCYRLVVDGIDRLKRRKWEALRQL